MASELNNDLILEFKCPNCNEYMDPPIKSCETGHNFCNSCFSQINICSLCKNPKSLATRNFVLEKLYEKLTFPCKNLGIGCTENIKGSEMAEHVKAHCDYRNISCVLHSNCNWVGKIADIEFHCVSSHGIDFEPPADLIYKFSLDFNIEMQYTYRRIIKCHNQIFLFTFLSNKPTMGWNVFHFGKRNDSKNFYFKIVLHNNITVESPCVSSTLYSVHKVIGDVVVPLEHLKERCIDTKLMYCLTLQIKIKTISSNGTLQMMTTQHNKIKEYKQINTI